MAELTVTLRNDTSSVWTLAVFLSIPTAASQLSVAWMLTSPVAGSGTGYTSWTPDAPAVCLGLPALSSGTQVYRQTLARAAAANQGWTVTSSSGAFLLTQTGSSVTPGQIQIANASGQLVNAALGFSGTAAIYAPSLPSGLTAGFIPSPQYWMILAQSIQAGQVVANGSYGSSSLSRSQSHIAGIFSQPQQLIFPSRQPNALVTASIDGGSLSTTITYS
jgi:hypothetical protein